MRFLLGFVFLLNLVGVAFADPTLSPQRCLEDLHKLIQNQGPSNLKSSDINYSQNWIKLNFDNVSNFNFNQIHSYVYSDDVKTPYVTIFTDPETLDKTYILFIDKESLLNSTPSLATQKTVKQFFERRELTLVKKEDVSVAPIKKRPFEFGDPKKFDWQKIFVRSEDERTGGQEYIEAMVSNVTQSMSAIDKIIFGKTLFGSGHITKGNYRDFIIKQMKMIIRDNYRGYVYGEIAKDADNAGVLLHELWFITDSVWERKLQKEAISTDIPMGHAPLQYTQTFSGIYLNVHNFRQGPVTFHRYPGKKDRFKIIERLAQMFNELKQDILKGREDQLFFEHLSDYYHLGINSHLFYRGNNSLFMSHVNYLLMVRGFKGIPHGRLDFAALGENHIEFRRILMKAIAAENPNIQARLIDVAP